MRSHREVHILCATYNGGRFVREQIESIQSQCHPRWRLLIRDDGSQDETVQIVSELARRDRRICLLHDGEGNLGPAQNFGALMQHALFSNAECLMFADQDDVWRSDKIARTLAAFDTAESRYGAAAPILVHTDLEVVDATLRTLHTSFMKLQRLHHVDAQPLPTLLVQNFVTGCTMMFNRPLLELALPMPPEAAMHDWWLALCAAGAGRVEFVPMATVRYRQHSRNQVGVNGLLRSMRRLAGHGPLLESLVKRHLGPIRQARSLRTRLMERGQYADAGTLPLLNQFCQLHTPDFSRPARLRGLWRNGFRHQTVIRNLLLLLVSTLLVPNHCYEFSDDMEVGSVSHKRRSA